MLEVLIEVNDRVNSLITYKADNPGCDHWQTRKESERRGFGDCEDYAIFKYQELRDLGLHPELLYCDHLTPARLMDGVIIEKPKRTSHMVCLQGRLVLDNLVTNILNIDERPDLNPVYVISEDGMRAWSQSRVMPPFKHSVFRELWQRIQRGE